MTALTTGYKPLLKPSPFPGHTYQRKIKSGEVVYENAVLAVNSAGTFEPVSADNTLVAYGFARMEYGVDSLTGDGTIECYADTGCKLLTGSGLTDADEGATVYALDDSTFSLSSSSGTRPVMGKLIEVVSATSGYVAVDPTFSTLATAANVANAGMTVAKKTVTVGHADLDAAATTQSINIGTSLPANARIVGVSLHTATAFSGGTVSALKLDIGSTGDVDAIVAQADLYAAVVDGQAASCPAGISPNKLFASATQLAAKFTATGDNLVNLTAGAVTIDVLYVVLA